MSHLRITCVFTGRYFSTSSFFLLSKNGRKTWVKTKDAMNKFKCSPNINLIFHTLYVLPPHQILTKKMMMQVEDHVATCMELKELNDWRE
jgi:hypothetical protein